MLKLFWSIIVDEAGGLGITRGSLVSAIADDSGGGGPDDVIKIRRLINRKGRQFCNITNWPFLRSEVNFSITNALGHTYSGDDYLPTTFKRVIKGHIKDSSGEHYPLHEIGIDEFKSLPNPDEEEEMPDSFCITRIISSTHWQIAFNRKPDQTYTVYLEIELQWTNLTADTSETLITKDYYDAFAHYCCITRFAQQGDTESYQLYKDDWWNAQSPQGTILGQILSNLHPPSMDQAIQVDVRYADPYNRRGDYKHIRSYHEFANRD